MIPERARKILERLIATARTGSNTTKETFYDIAEDAADLLMADSNEATDETLPGSPPEVE